MTSATVTLAHDRHPDRTLLSRLGWIWIGVIGLLFVLLHRNFLVFSFRNATHEWSGDWSHALIVPLISLYFIYQHRDGLAAMTPRVCWWGLPIMFAGLLSFAVWIYPGRNDMLQGYSMILTLLGLALFLLGTRMMRVLWFPIVYLVLGVKVAPRLWDHVAVALQHIAAASSAVLLKFFSVFLDFEVTHRGSTIDLGFMENGQWVVEGFNVAEACAGLRMLMAFIALGAAMAFLADRSWWQRTLMLLSAIPVAIAVNVGRVTVLGLLFLVDKEMAQGAFHTFIGMLMLIPAAGLFLLIGWILDRLVIEEPDTSSGPPPIARVEPVADDEQDQSGIDKRGLLGGLAVGIVLTAMLGLCVVLAMGTVRPDLIATLLSRPVAAASAPSAGTELGIYAAILIAVALIGGALWTLRRLALTTSPLTQRRVLAPAVAVGVLFTTAVGLNGVVVATKAVLIKEPIPLRKSLIWVPAQLGNWQLIAEDDALDSAALEALGTRDYISRVYRDLSAPEDKPGSVLKLHVAYYTGTPDTVPHVPDRCYVAGGLAAVDTDSHQLELRGPTYRRTGQGWTAITQLDPGEAFLPSREVPATIFTFVRPGTTDRRSNVLYFFVANGRYLSTPEGVRLQGFDLRDRHSYYCKIEVLWMGVGDPQEAARRSAQFLSVALPEIMACLPDWREVQARTQAPAADRDGAGISQDHSGNGPMVSSGG